MRIYKIFFSVFILLFTLVFSISGVMGFDQQKQTKGMPEGQPVFPVTDDSDIKMNQDTIEADRLVTLEVDNGLVSSEVSSEVASIAMPADTISLIADDGVPESTFGVNSASYGYQFIWLNRFTPAITAYPFDLEQIQVLFASSTVNVGDTIHLAVYEDSDGNPANGANHLATFNATVSVVDGASWSTYTLNPPVRLNGPGDVLIAAINRNVVSGVSLPTYPAALDTTTSQGRSWFGWWTTDPPNPPTLPANNVFDTTDNRGFSGNWLIRGYGQTVSSEFIAPSNLTATTVSASQIDLAWQDNSSDETAFHIERSPDGISWTEIGTVGADVTSYNDTNLSCKTTYHYRIRAYRNSDLQYSNYSSPKSTATQSCIDPPIATSCVQYEFGSPNMQVSVYADGREWDFEAEDGMPEVVSVSTKSILGSTNNGTFYIQVLLNGNAIASWEQTVATSTLIPYYHSNNISVVLQPGDIITYHIHGGTMSTRAGAISGVNNVELCPALQSPTHLSTTAISNSQIDLTWQDNSSDETAFHIERSPDGINWTEIATVGESETSFSDTSLGCNTTYYYRVRSYRDDDAQYSQYSDIASATTQLCDVLPPSGLVATPISDSQINLTWQDNSSDETTFHIERSPDGTNWTEIDTVGESEATYNDTSLVCNTTYHYRVRAFRDDDTQYSQYSDIASATTQLCDVLPPSGLAATSISDSQINLTWQDNSSDETAFHIERSPDGTNWTEIATVDENNTTYNDTSLVCNTTYHYRVRAFRDDDIQYSEYSNTVSATTQLCVVSPPSGLVATPISDSQIDLIWQDNSSDETAFHITRSLDGTIWTDIDTVGESETTFSDTSLVCNTTYYYRVRAYRDSDAQYSSYSNSVNAMTKICQYKIFLPVVIHMPPPPSFAPTLNDISNPDGARNFTVSWGAVTGATEYTLQQDSNAAFSNPTTVYSGTDISATVTVGDVGTYYYRVKAMNTSGSSPWSNIVSIVVTQEVIVPQPGYWSAGSVSLEVSSDSTMVNWFELDNIYISGCGWYTLRWEDLPITNGQFSKGEFLTPTSASGAATWIVYPTCTGGLALGTTSWSATWQHTQSMRVSLNRGNLILMTSENE